MESRRASFYREIVERMFLDIWIKLARRNHSYMKKRNKNKLIKLYNTMCEDMDKWVSKQKVKTRRVKKAPKRIKRKR